MGKTISERNLNGTFKKGHSGNPSTQFKKGEVNNPKGGPKSWFTIFCEKMNVDSEVKYPKSDVLKILEWIIQLNLDDLDKVRDNPECPAIIISFIDGMKADRQEGKTITVNSVLDRILGKATQKTEHTGKNGGPIQTESLEVQVFRDSIKHLTKKDLLELAEKTGGFEDKAEV